GGVHYNARQYEKAIQLLLEAGRDLRDSAVVCELLAWCYLQTGEPQKALASANRAAELSGRNSSSLAALAHAHAASGDRTAAAAVLQEIESMAQQRYISAYDRAAV